MSPAHAQVNFDFDLDSEPIVGPLRHTDGRTTTFNGWIPLVSILQDAATTRPGEGHQPAAPTTSLWPQ
jgi:hypothetical protein